MNNTNWLDGSLYPDTQTPATLKTFEDKIDFIARLCGAWDFGLLPYENTIQEIQKEQWKSAVDACRLLTSPSYHLLRRWHNLPPLAYLGQEIAIIRDDPWLEYV